MAAQHIINVSGGKDSTACYLLALERGRPFRAVWADTGNEHPATVDFIKALPDRTGGPQVERVVADFTDQIAKKRRFIAEKWLEKGVPAERVERALAVLHPTGNPFLDLCMLKGRFPGSAGQFCTGELKVKPMERDVIGPALGRGDVIQWLGLRRDESRNRANTPRIRRVRWTDPAATLVYFAPIAAWKANAVFWLHERHGLSPNPLYGLGAGRVGCWPCIHATKKELRVIAQFDPGAVDRLAEWEALVAEASKRGAATFFAPDKTPQGAAMSARGEKGGIDGAAYPDARDVFDWAQTLRGGKQYDLEVLLCGSEAGFCE